MDPMLSLMDDGLLPRRRLRLNCPTLDSQCYHVDQGPAAAKEQSRTQASVGSPKAGCRK